MTSVMSDSRRPVSCLDNILEVPILVEDFGVQFVNRVHVELHGEVLNERSSCYDDGVVYKCDNRATAAKVSDCGAKSIFG